MVEESVWDRAMEESQAHPYPRAGMAAYVFAGLFYIGPLLLMMLLFLEFQCYDSSLQRLPDCRPVDVPEIVFWSAWISWLPAILAALGSGLSKKYRPGWTLLWAFLGCTAVAFVLLLLAALLGQ